MREKVEFAKNTPVEVVLAYASGREIDGVNGPSYMYSTADERVFFATPTLNLKLQETAPHAGDRFSICLRNNKETGNKNQWDVRRVNSEPTAPRNGQGLVPPAAPVNGNVNTTNSHGNGNTNGNGNGHSNGNGHGPTPAAPSLMTGQGQGMLDQFIACYEVLCAVENYSRLKNRPVEFTSEDFRATAISCYIAQSRGGR